jgi:hypothetical protein
MVPVSTVRPKCTFRRPDCNGFVADELITARGESLARDCIRRNQFDLVEFAQRKVRTCLIEPKSSA